MPDLTPIKMTFHSGLHVGAHGDSAESTYVTIPSDTIFAASVDAWTRTGGDPEAFSAPFLGEDVQPPFLISSAFPFVGEVNFYPMPVNRALLVGEDALAQVGKSVKRTRFISEGLLLKALSGENLASYLYPADEITEPTSGVAIQRGNFWLTVEEVEKLPEAFQRSKGKLRTLRFLDVYKITRIPRVTISRITSASNIYHVGRTTFALGCGLWFAVQWHDPDQELGGDGIKSMRADFLNTLGVLQEDGLGGERTSGYGGFSFREESPIRFPDPVPDHPIMLLSRYHPREDELPEALTGTGSAYQLDSVGGWLRSADGAAQRRKRLTMVSEGSIVTFLSEPMGDLTDVRPTYAQEPGGEELPGLPHPVYRAGFGLGIGWPERFSNELEKE